MLTLRTSAVLTALRHSDNLSAWRQTVRISCSCHDIFTSSLQTYTQPPSVTVSNLWGAVEAQLHCSATLWYRQPLQWMQNYCCVPLGSETRIYQFPSKKYRSIEVRSRISKWETRNSASTQTSDFRQNATKQYMYLMWNTAVNTIQYNTIKTICNALKVDRLIECYFPNDYHCLWLAQRAGIYISK